MPEISIIVPVYKAEKYLPQCIESILAQTFTDFELILVDDGSPDDSGAICDTYSEKDNRIKVIHQDNAGVSAARNAALDIARGKYIMFCDSDDWVEPDWCKCMYEAIQTPNVVMAVCGYKEWKNDLLINAWKFNKDRNMIKLSEIFDTPFAGAPWNKIYIREQIEMFNIRFSTDICFGEDVRFILKYISTFDSENEILFSYLSLNNYRIVEGSLSNKYIRNFWKLEKELVQIRLDVAKKFNTNLEKYQERINYYYYRLVYFSIHNLFSQKNDSTFFQKYKELKEIVASVEFNEMQKSEHFQSFPFWYQLILKKRMSLLLYMYHQWRG